MEIKTNAHNESIKYIDMDGVRFIHFEQLNNFQITLFSMTAYCSSICEIEVSPLELEHSQFTDYNDRVCPLIRIPELPCHISFEDLDSYLLVCELFSMPANQAVVDAVKADLEA